MECSPVFPIPLTSVFLLFLLLVPIFMSFVLSPFSYFPLLHSLCSPSLSSPMQECLFMSYVCNVLASDSFCQSCH